MITTPEHIQNRLHEISGLVKEAAVVDYEGRRIAVICPDLAEAAKRGIINIEEELRWYAVELYNIEAAPSERLDGYRIVKETLPRSGDGGIDTDGVLELLSVQGHSCEDEEGDDGSEVYRVVKSYLEGVTARTVCPSAHLELDLGLDSLDYIELFEFVRSSFGVTMDEKTFAHMMAVEELCAYIDTRKQRLEPSKPSLQEILHHKCTQKLVYSPVLMVLWKTALMPLLKLWFGLKISGREHLPKEPFIIAPTHASMLDGFVIVGALPYAVLQNTFFLAYEPVFGRGILRPLSLNGQNILIDANKGLKEAMLRSAMPLKEGKNLVIFPEGARSRDGKLLAFKKFFAILSCELDIPVVPVVLKGTFEAMEAGRLFPRPVPVSITFLEPVYPAGLGYEEIKERTRTAIEAEINKSAK